MSEALLVARQVHEAGTYNAPGADQHQAVDHLGYARGSTGAINVNQGGVTGLAQVGSNGRAITRGAGNERIKGGTPGIHGVWDQLDFFECNLRLVGHVGVPRGESGKS